MYLEKYYTLPITLGFLVCILGTLYIAYITNINSISGDKTSKRVILRFIALDVAVIVVVGILFYTLYDYKKSELIVSFQNGETIICNSRYKDALIKKSDGYILQSDYLIKNNTAIDIGRCKVLK